MINFKMKGAITMIRENALGKKIAATMSAFDISAGFCCR